MGPPRPQQLVGLASGPVMTPDASVGLHPPGRPDGFPGGQGGPAAQVEGSGRPRAHLVPLRGYAGWSVPQWGVPPILMSF